MSILHAGLLLAAALGTASATPVDAATDDETPSRGQGTPNLEYGLLGGNGSVFLRNGNGAYGSGDTGTNQGLGGPREPGTVGDMIGQTVQTTGEVADLAGSLLNTRTIPTHPLYAAEQALQGLIAERGSAIPAVAPLTVDPPNVRYATADTARPAFAADPSVAEIGVEVAEYIEENPEDAPAYALQARVQEVSGDYEAAARGYQRAIELGQDDSRTWTWLAGALHRAGDYPQATAASRRALELEPGNKAAQAVLALSRGRDLNARLPERPRAEAASEDSRPRWSAAGVGALPLPGADVRRPAAVDAAVRGAVSALKVKDYASARHHAERALASDPGNVEARYLRAAALLKQRDYAGALEEAERAEAAAPGNRALRLTRAWALNKLGRFEEADREAGSLLSRDSRDSLALLSRAHARAGLRDREAALQTLRRLAETGPAEWSPLYERAKAAPRSEDLLLIFDDDLLGGLRAPAPAPQEPGVPWGYLAVLGGGILSALALLAAGASRRGQEQVSAFWTQYRALGELGTGGMGVVYEAVDLALQRKVAVKRMKDEIRSDPREHQRFLGEARLVAALKHPAIVEIYSIHAEEGALYLVFEHVAGATLSERIRERGRLAPGEAARILGRAAEAVEYAHARGVIHRDLKPSNIMVTGDGAVKVMDFGIARRAREALSSAAGMPTLSGTPPYMAPEQEQGTVRKESDVFALGVCLYEMLTGELPYAGRGAAMTMQKLEGRWTPLRERLPGASEALERALAKALDPDPARRWPSPSAFAAAALGAVEAYPANPSKNSSINAGTSSA